jgi:hypothetical protein
MARTPRRPVFVLLAAALVTALPVAAADERVDLDAIYRIKEEGFQRSQVMAIASYLTDVHGPRLTGSPNIRAAAEWTLKQLAEWGIASARLEPWGPFGRGWTNERTVVHAVSPQSYPIIAYSKAWAPGTEGPVRGEVVAAPIESEKDFETYRGRLRGRIVFMQPARDVTAWFTPPGRRLSDEDLRELATENDHRREAQPRRPPQDQGFARRRLQFYKDEGAIAVVETGRVGDGGTVFATGATRDSKLAVDIPQIVMAVEHYGRILRTLERGIPVVLEIDLRNRFVDGDANAFNIIADLPGTDRADELVMIGAHFDSWHTGTGATDNAAGSAVMLEALRILKASGLRLRRTVRLALWTGEEQGLLGSRAYVREHFADPETMQLKPGHAKLSAYFNVDNGTGAIRGVYLQGNEAVAPIFAAWMEPFRNLGMTTLSIRDTIGTDHLAFNAVGLPGFQFIQDPIEYSSRTHHSNMDVYERLQAPDMKQNAVIVAAFAYHAANREGLLPRKPLPPPQRRQPTTTATR